MAEPLSEPQTRLFGFAKPFVDAAKVILETMAHTQLVPCEPEIRNDEISKGDYSSILGISGEFSTGSGESGRYKGMIVVSFPEATYLKIASAIFGEEYSEYSNDLADLGTEIDNMIVGNAKRELQEMGFTSNMAIPSSISGPGYKISYPGPTTVTIIPIDCDHGRFYIEAAYQEN
jgi:chemotaxis protein CheX